MEGERPSGGRKLENVANEYEKMYLRNLVMEYRGK